VRGTTLAVALVVVARAVVEEGSPDMARSMAGT
jgi:hypothetical protein